MIKFKKVGGIRFLRIGRVQFSFCLCRPSAPSRAKARSVHRPSGLLTVREVAAQSLVLRGAYDIDADVWVGPGGVVMACGRDR